jgi:hypothetical protein
MTFKIRIGKFGILLIVLIVIVYTIWFVFFQDVIQFILENAISTETGERDIITGWIGTLFLPLLVVVGILGFIGMIFYLIYKIKGKEIE